jgi:hypothetical protein
MDFVFELPRNSKCNDFMLVVVNCLNKSTHFLPIKATHWACEIAYIFIQEVGRLLGVPKVTLLDGDLKLLSNSSRVFSMIWTQI